MNVFKRKWTRPGRTKFRLTNAQRKPKKISNKRKTESSQSNWRLEICRAGRSTTQRSKIRWRKSYSGSKESCTHEKITWFSWRMRRQCWGKKSKIASCTTRSRATRAFWVALQNCDKVETVAWPNLAAPPYQLKENESRFKILQVHWAEKGQILQIMWQVKRTIQIFLTFWTAKDRASLLVKFSLPRSTREPGSWCPICKGIPTTSPKMESSSRTKAASPPHSKTKVAKPSIKVKPLTTWSMNLSLSNESKSLTQSTANMRKSTQRPKSSRIWPTKCTTWGTAKLHIISTRNTRSKLRKTIQWRWFTSRAIRSRLCREPRSRFRTRRYIWNAIAWMVVVLVQEGTARLDLSNIRSCRPFSTTSSNVSNRWLSKFRSRYRRETSSKSQPWLR